jgi:NAD(P)-dependent dehydrogenase (short-subunit alcohol dehydrogenase family)/acyl carrier protein
MAQARHVGKIVLSMPESVAPTKPLLRDDATYLVTGGLGALGMHTARWLVDRGAKHIVLTGRRPPGDAAARRLLELEQRGTRIVVQQLDVADETAMQRVLMEIAKRGPALRGVIHAAGILDDGVLIQQTADRFSRVRRGKAEGALVLDRLTRALPLDFFVMYSAAGLLLGPPGQGSYAAANAELDALAHVRRAAGLPALSVAWGMWRDGGMAASNSQAGRESWTERGLGWIDAEQGFTRLERLMREGAVHAAVLPIDWHRFVEQLPPGVDEAFFSRLTRKTRGAPPTSQTAPSGRSVADTWRALAESQRRPAIVAHVQKKALLVIGLPDSTPLDPRQPLKEAGLDSLMAVELRNLLARSVGTSLPATLLFDYPSVDAITAFFLKRLELAATVPATSNGKSQERPADAGVAHLSDAEAEAELLAELESSTSRGRS